MAVFQRPHEYGTRPKTSPSAVMSGRQAQNTSNSPLLAMPNPLIGEAPSAQQQKSVPSGIPYSESASECEDDGFIDSYIPAFVIEDDGNLHPAVRAAKEDAFCTSLVGCDLNRNRKLLDHFKRYHLTDFFDDRGQRRYQNLSMSFAAKQNPDTQCGFGSSGIAQPGFDFSKVSNVHLSARAYRLATASVQKDRDKARKKVEEEYCKLDDVRKMQCEDIKRRQHDMFFLEVASYEQYLPPDITDADLLPLDVSRSQERDDRRRFERLNALVLEVATKMEWPGEAAHGTHPLTTALQQFMLKKEHVFELLCSIASWTSAAGLSSHMGVDRAVFCRYITGLGFVDQRKLPYVWAVSVFDQFAKPVRISGFFDCEWNSNADNSVNDRVAFAAQLSKWDFVNVMDTIIRCRFTAVDLNWLMASIRETTAYLTQELVAKEEQASSFVERGSCAPKARRESRTSKTMTFDHLTAAPHMPREDDQKEGAREATIINRHRRITGMLAEPEVLQLVEQFRPFFQQLFDLYVESSESNEGGVDTSDEPPAMEFVGFLQFCQDFRIVPCLVTTHEVSREFHSAECVSIRRQKVEKQGSTSQSEEERRKVNLRNFADLVLKAHSDPNAAFVAFDTNRNGEIRLPIFRLGAGRVGFTGNYKDVFAELSEHHGVIRRGQFNKLLEFASPDLQGSLHSARGPKSRATKNEAVRCATAPGRSDKIPQNESLATKRTTEWRKMSIERKMSVEGSRNQTRDAKNRALPSLGDAPITESLTSASSPEFEDIEVSTFGLGAFVETLCRIGLSYLLVHGNAVQLGASSRAKIVWLLVHLQASIDHWRQSIDRRLNDHMSIEKNESGNIGANSNLDGIVGQKLVSRGLAKVLERITLHSFKDLKPMPLQLDSYYLHRARPDAIVGADSASKSESRISPKRRRKSASDFLSNVTEQRTSVRRSSAQSASARPSLELSTSDARTLASKTSFLRRRSSTQGCLESSALTSISLSEVDDQDLRPQTCSPRRGFNVPESLVSIDSSLTDPISQIASGFEKKVADVADDASQGSKQSRKSRSKNGATANSESVKETTQMTDEQQERRQDIVQSAISNRPPPPPMRDDSFKFEDFLFKRLMRKVSPPKKRQPLDAKSPALPSRCSTPRVVQSRGRRSSHQMELAQLLEKTSSPIEAAQLKNTVLSQERGNLLNGLRSCIGKLDRCELTPPPMSTYASQLNERLELMMGWSPEPLKPHSAPGGSLQRQVDL